MATFLFVTFEAGGNVPPVFGLARRLVARGHAVHVLSEPCLADEARAAGATLHAFTRHFTRTDRQEPILEDWRARSPVGALRSTMREVIYGPARHVAVDTAEAIRRVSPQALAVDFMLPGALPAAEAAGLPAGVLWHMPEYLAGTGRPAAGPGFLPRHDAIGRLRDGLMTALLHRLVAPHRADVDAARAAVGLGPLPREVKPMDLYHRADRRLILTTRAFDFPIDPAPPNVRYVGPVLDPPAWTGELPPLPWPDDDPRPLVLVSLSSTFQDQGDAIRRIMTALGTLDVRAVVTLGPAMTAESFRPPPNVHVVAALPHDLLLPRVAAVVTHAGHGTVMRALSHGVPLLCLPMGRDQDDNAARVVHHGAGLRLRRTAPAPRIAEVVRKLLVTPAYRAGAERLKVAIQADLAADRGAAELETLVGA